VPNGMLGGVRGSDDTYSIGLAAADFPGEYKDIRSEVYDICYNVTDMRVGGTHECPLLKNAMKNG
uniref:hypothetical protein n=1 Tax=Faecalibaculum rodentium TaxID=1702221 RepID=UPI002730D0F8